MSFLPELEFFLNFKRKIRYRETNLLQRIYHLNNEQIGQEIQTLLMNEILSRFNIFFIKDGGGGGGAIDCSTSAEIKAFEKERNVLGFPQCLH